VTAAPVLRLGAEAPGGLTLPAALPTPGQLYGPRGVWTDGRRLAVADTGNHRVLLWHRIPERDGAAADVVLGQPDATSEGPAAGGTSTLRGMHLPTGVAVVDGSLVVADAWHHRVLVWHGWPSDFAPPDVVLGQPDAESVLPNAGGEPAADTFYWPFGMGRSADLFWVADTGNRRVLGWYGGLPDHSRAADVVLGQPTMAVRDDNRGSDPTADSFRWPHAVVGDDQTLWVADAGDHRVLGWTPVPDADQPAALVLGQPTFTDAGEFKNDPQGPSRLRFPYGVAFDGQRLVVADTSNNRVLVWHKAPRDGRGAPADEVLGQPDFEAHGENRWQAVTDDSFCWPYAVSAADDLVAVADSGNNRVVVWRVP
jgi:hypothetical protein